jgi:hypothetical protein
MTMRDSGGHVREMRPMAIFILAPLEKHTTTTTQERARERGKMDGR